MFTTELKLFFRNQNDWHKFYVSWDAIMQDTSQTLHKKTRDHTKRVPDAAKENTWSYEARPRRCAAQEKKQNKQVLLLAEPNEKQIIQNTHK